MLSWKEPKIQISSHIFINFCFLKKSQPRPKSQGVLFLLGTLINFPDFFKSLKISRKKCFWKCQIQAFTREQKRFNVTKTGAEVGKTEPIFAENFRIR